MMRKLQALRSIQVSEGVVCVVFKRYCYRGYFPNHNFMINPSIETLRT